MESSKKIVILSTFYDPFMSGAEQMVKEVVERLGNQHEIILITSRIDNKLPKIEKRDNYLLVRVGLGYKIDKYLYPIFASLEARKYKPDIIHAIMESYAGGALVFCKYFCKKSYRILTLQSGDLDDKRNQKRLIFKFFWKLIHQSPDKITAISNFLKHRAERLGVDSKRIEVIPNGVELSIIPQGINKIDDRVICVARLSWEKGLNYLIEGWKKVAKEFPNARLVLVGEGDKRNEIELMIQKNDLGESIKLLGQKTHDEVLKEISKSQIFICPSLAEGLGIVFIEAQACGATVIGTDIGGIPDVIQDGENGLLVESNNSEEITKSLLDLLKDEDKRLFLSNNALKTVKKYNWQEIIDKVNRIYKKI